MRCAPSELLCLLFAIAIASPVAAQNPPAAPPKTTPPPAPAPAPASTAGRARQAATPPANARLALTVMVTALDGKTIPETTVKAAGPVDREAPTDPSGLVTFQNMAPGTYRLRFEHPQFVTFEKEITLGVGKPLRTSASLTAAPPPPAPARAEPPPAPTPATPPPAGSYSPSSVDIPDLFEKNFVGSAAVKRSPIGCTATSTSTLVQLRDPLADHAHADADELIYVVAGEGTHKVGGREIALSSGIFSVVPRGTTHGIVRRGRQPLVLISTLSGPVCPAQ
jgi:mannose-6-phosphate isomerase-like protein (cupin superfamily)